MHHAMAVIILLRMCNYSTLLSCDVEKFSSFKILSLRGIYRRKLNHSENFLIYDILVFNNLTLYIIIVVYNISDIVYNISDIVYIVVYNSYI